MKEIVIATRGSALALWQAEHLQNELKKEGVKSSLNIIKTKGDLTQHLSFDKIEGKGFFTKEIEDALLANQADIAVHSMKDLPTSHPEGLVLGGVSERANPCDLLLIKESSAQADKILQLPEKAVVGTSSIRRKVQIKHLRKDVTTIDLRGNVPTRIKKLRDGDEMDAIIIAAAGVERLGLELEGIVKVILHPKEFVPAPAQGILAYQCRKEDTHIRKILNKIHHRDVSACSNVERSILNKMDGGCHLPLGAYCYEDQAGNYHCNAVYSPDEGKTLKRASLSQSTTVGMANQIFLQLKSV